MLSLACRRFRRRFTPAAADGHRRSCVACDGWAATLERAAGVRLPLPGHLASELRAIGASTAAKVVPFRVPRVAMPPALAARLRAVRPVPARPELPEWARNSRLAFAASVLLAVLIGPLVGPGADRARSAFATLGTVVRPAVAAGSAAGREELDRVRERFGERVRGDAEGLALARHRVFVSLDQLTHEVAAVAEDLSLPDPSGTTPEVTRSPE